MRIALTILILMTGCRTVETTRQQLSSDPIRCIDQAQEQFDECAKSVEIAGVGRGISRINAENKDLYDLDASYAQAQSLDICQARLSMNQQRCSMYEQHPELRAEQEAVERRETDAALQCLKGFASDTNRCVKVAAHDKGKIQDCLNELDTNSPDCAPNMNECEAHATGWLALCLERNKADRLNAGECYSKLKHWLRNC